MYIGDIKTDRERRDYTTTRREYLILPVINGSAASLRVQSFRVVNPVRNESFTNGDLNTVQTYVFNRANFATARRSIPP